MQTDIIIPDHIPRIGFCSDIHANLNHVVQMTKRRPDVEYWFCAGDVVDMYKGVHFNQPALRAMARLGIPSVLGNHDYHVRQHDGKRLDQEARTYLEALPFRLRVTFAGRRISIYHATPKSRDDFIRPEAGAPTYLKLFGDEPADVIVLGHTHEAYLKHFGTKQFINPGALGIPLVPATFCVMERDGTVAFEFLISGP